jgi:hypothetical protein
VRVSQDSSTNKFGRVQGSESQPLPNEKYFGSYSPLVVLFLGMKVHIVNMVQIGPPIYH